MRIIPKWEDLSKKIYWDRTVSLDVWKEKTSQGHRSYLWDAISGMTPVEFVFFYGLERFRLDWPTLRISLPRESILRAPVFDLAWSQALGGGWNLKPFADFYELPVFRREFLVQASKIPGQSALDIAQAIGMEPHLASKQAVILVREGKLKLVNVEKGCRRKKALYPVYWKNTVDA